MKGEAAEATDPLEGLFDLFESEGEELYLVGGYVRDLLLGRETGDCDLATAAPPEKTLRILAGAGHTTYAIGMEFGTVAALLRGDGTEVQITSYRCRESYRKGSRHPDVVFGKSLEEDLKRRDFTVNAIAMDRTGEVIDPTGGRGDIRRKVLRTPLDPAETFGEDPLRMLRAFRFAAALGFSMEPGTLEAVKEKHRCILDISRERWKMEMDSLLSVADGGRVAGSLRMMKDTGILEDMVPEFVPMFLLEGVPQGPAHDLDLWEHTLAAVAASTGNDALLRWAVLLHDIGKPSTLTADGDGTPHFHGHEKRGAELAGKVADRFRFSRRDRKLLCLLVAGHLRPVQYSREWSDRAVRKLVRESGDHLGLLLRLAEADMAAHSEPLASKGMERLEELKTRIRDLAPAARRRVLPSELGRILARRVGGDIASSPQVGVILSNLEELVHQGRLPEMADPSVYLDYLREHPETAGRNC